MVRALATDVEGPGSRQLEHGIFRKPFMFIQQGTGTQLFIAGDVRGVAPHLTYTG